MEYSWGHRRRFNSYVDHMRKIFGGRIQKLTIDAGFTCPNRDGTKGTGGCTYCLNEAFNPSYCNPRKSVRQQLIEGMEFHMNRYRKARQFLAYFQAYSNTYAKVEHLGELYSEALKVKGVMGLVIGTRPDCMDDEKMQLLHELAMKYYVLVEYGVETVYDKTLQRINRGHTFDDSLEAIEQTVQASIPVGVHLIFGLPGENLQDMLDSVSVISKLPLNNIKFHQLQLLKGTEMELEYLHNPDDFHIFGMDEYLEFIISYIERLNPAFVVERIAGETPPRYATLLPWGPRYDTILAKFERLLEEKDTWQGKKFVERKKKGINV